MKLITALLIILIANTCQNADKEQARIKKQLVRQYSAKTLYGSNEIRKNELELAFETGTDKDGNQTYSINYLNDSKDTTWYHQKSIEKIIDDKTCFYRDTTLLLCKLKKNDTIQIFYPPDIDKPTTFEFYDKKGLIGAIFPSNTKKYPFKKSFLSERKFDVVGNLTYYVNTEYYLPEDFDPEKNQHYKTLKTNLVQAGTGKVVEIEYVYYE